MWLRICSIEKRRRALCSFRGNKQEALLSEQGFRGSPSSGRAVPERSATRGRCWAAIHTGGASARFVLPLALRPPSGFCHFCPAPQIFPHTGSFSFVFPFASFSSLFFFPFSLIFYHFCLGTPSAHSPALSSSSLTLSHTSALHSHC